MKYRAIVADPPWDYADTETGNGCWDRSGSRIESANNRGRGAAEGHYSALTLEDICSLPIPAANDAYCFLWVTNRHLLEGFAAVVLRAWGFRPITLRYWDKVHMGLGYYIRNDTEAIAFGVRGKPGQFLDTMRSQLREPRSRHSRKPEVSYADIERCCAGPYLELFARELREGWTCWGKEVGDSLGIGFNPEVWRGIS